MEDVIKKDVSATLTTAEKPRYSSAAEYFLKGAETFLMNYNLQIQGIVDVEKMKKQHQEVLDEKIKKVQGENEQGQKVQKKSGGLLKMALFTSSVVIFMMPKWRGIIFNYIQSYKESNRNFINLLNSGKNIFKNVISILGTFGKRVLVQLGMLFDKLVGQIVFPLFDKVLYLFDVLLNGESFTVSFGHKENIFRYLFQQVVYKIFDILVQNSSFFSILNTFGLSIYKHAKMRPKLMAYLKYGSKELMKALKSQGDNAQGAFEDTHRVTEEKDFFGKYWKEYTVPARQKWKSVNEYNEGQSPIEGKSSSKSDMGWGQVSPIIADYLTDVYDVQGAAFVREFEEGKMGSFDINPFSSHQPWNKTMDDKWKSIKENKIDYEGDTDETSLENLRYTDLGHLRSILSDIKSSIDELPIEMRHTNLYKQIIYEYEHFHYILGSGAIGMSVNSYGELLFLGLVVEVAYYQWYHSKQRSELWTEINDQRKGLVDIYRDKAQNYVKSFQIVTNVQELDRLMSSTRIDLKSYGQKLNYIFSQWAKGNDMFQKVDKRPEILYKKLNFKRLVDIVYFLGRQFQNLKIGIELHQQELSNYNFNFVDYNLNVGYNTKDNEQTKQMNVLFDEKYSLSDKCDDIQRNFLQARDNELKLRNERKELFQKLLNIVKRNKEGKISNIDITSRKSRRKSLELKLENKKKQLENKKSSNSTSIPQGPNTIMQMQVPIHIYTGDYSNLMA